MSTATWTGVQKRIKASQIPPVYAILFLVFVLAIIIDSIFGRGQMLTQEILTNMIVRSVALGIVAVGQTYVMIGASIDLSVAYMVSVTAVMASFIMQGEQANVPMAVFLVLLIGAAVGLVNGLVITKLKVNPFIGTLGVGLLLKGFLNASFDNFVGAVPRTFQWLGYGYIGPIPVSVLLLLAVALIGGFILQRTRFGSHLYGVGGSEEVARLSGLRTDRVLILAHILCSITAVLTGLFIVSRLRSGAPWVGPTVCTISNRSRPWSWAGPHCPEERGA